MTLTIQLSDEQVTVLRDKAAAEGLSVEQWIQKLAEKDGGPRSLEELPPIWEVIAENMKRVPREDLAALPKDGASQIDHYVYGVPKRAL